jgi:hypothetical protein
MPVIRAGVGLRRSQLGIVRAWPHQETRDLRDTVLNEYGLATKHYAWTVSEFSRQRKFLAREGYEASCRMVEGARKQCERLRNDLVNFRD